MLSWLVRLTENILMTPTDCVSASIHVLNMNQAIKVTVNFEVDVGFSIHWFYLSPSPLKHSYVLGCASAKATEPLTVRQEAEDGSQNPADTQRCPWHFQTPGPDMETSVQGTAGFKSAIGRSWSVSNPHSFGKKYFLNDFRYSYFSAVSSCLPSIVTYLSLMLKHWTKWIYMSGFICMHLYFIKCHRVLLL